MTILDAALALHDAGCAVLPAAADGSKRPAVDWKRWQTRRPDRRETLAMVGATPGIGVVCGTVSGSLEMLEAEGAAATLLPEVTAAMDDHGLGDVWRTITTGYTEASPAGGLHWLFRTPGPAHGNRKLARRPDPDGGVQVLFETRGEGGWVVVAPSAGTTHPTGRAWQLVAGSPADIPTISCEDRDAIYAVLGLFDRMPVANGPGFVGGASTDARGDRPGDEFNATASWADILDDWTAVRTMGKGYAWRRPGKNVGISATTGQAADGVDRLYVFTTSTELPSEVPLSKFGAYTHLHHGGNFAAAASELRRQGYGAPANPGMTLTEMVEAPVIKPAVAPQTHNMPADETPDPPSFIERTEDAQALALVTTCGHLIRHNITSGRWHTFLTGVWVEQSATGGMVREYARGLARHLPDGDNGATPWRKAMLSDAGVRHVLSMASTDPRIVAEATDFDTDPHLIGSGPTVTDLRTGQQRPAKPSDMISRRAGVVPSSEGADLWQTFLDQILDPDTARFLQRLFGLSLYGAVLEHVLIFLFGTGANGKTTFMDALRHAAGQLAVSLPAETLMIRKHEAHSTELAPLSGARLAVFNELPAGMRFDEARVKMLTGGDQVNARWLYGQPFSFTPSHTLWIVGNDKPATSSGGEAFWRRVRLVGFHRTIPAERRDPNLPEKLRAAAPAILQWGIDGWADYQTNGLAEPASVVADTAEYRAENDTVGRFLDECCQVSGNESLKVETRKVRAAYTAWCTDEGLQPVTATAFGLALRRAGVDQARSHGRKFYTGLSLLIGDDQESQQWP